VEPIGFGKQPGDRVSRASRQNEGGLHVTGFRLLWGMSLIEMAMGYARSRGLGAAARLGIADVLGDGERTVDQLATACRADPASLHRLLRALASFGIASESKPGIFVLTPIVSSSCWYQGVTTR
jgi:hypothetical protein